MITFSSMPFSLAMRALCSMCCTSLRKIRSRKKSARMGRSGIFGSSGLSPIITTASGRSATSSSAPICLAAPVPISAIAGGITTRMRLSTASVSGSRTQLIRPDSRSDAGSSPTGTCCEGSSTGSIVSDSDMSHP